jgi:hypothetical protein
MSAELQSQQAKAKILEKKVAAQNEVNRAKGKELDHHCNSATVIHP